MKKVTRYEFEPQDFDGSGQMIIRDSAEPGCANHTFMATVSYKIGYQHHVGPNTVFMVSMADGMCRAFPSTESMCESLNEDPVGYRPMTSQEIAQVMGDQGNRFPKGGMV